MGLKKAPDGELTDPTRRLRRADAPRDLVAWTSGREMQELWDECDRGDWLVWLASIEHVPVVAIVEAAVACARRAVKALPAGRLRKPLTRALRAAANLASSEICDKRAQACERIAAKPEAAGYRDAPPLRFEQAAASAGYAARSAEALLAADVRRIAERDHEGRARAAGIGAGDQIISRGQFPPLTFDPDDELMAMCVYAADNAIRHAARALAPRKATVERLESVEGELSELVFEVLDPVRNGLLAGKQSEALVRTLAIQPYVPTKAMQQHGGAELAPIGALAKKPMTATTIAFFIPCGGMGHFYAGHRTTGAILLAGSMLAFIGWVLGVLSILAWPTIMAADVMMAATATRRYNAGKILDVRAQGIVGAGVVVLAMLAGRIIL